MPVTIGMSGADAIQRQKLRNIDQARVDKRQRDKRLQRVKANVKTVMKLVEILPTEGCKLELASVWDYEDPVVYVDREYLPAVRKAVGPLHVESKDLADAEKRLICITLRADNFPGIQFRYERTLAEDARCKIVAHTSEYHSLACSLS
jgi:hypothetical protein